MVRNNRQLTRLFFILVIAMGLFGGWYASRNWQVDPAVFSAQDRSQETDWIDMLSTFGEETIQLFLGLASGE